jgi:hypothetical protein
MILHFAFLVCKTERKKKFKGALKIAEPLEEYSFQPPALF